MDERTSIMDNSRYRDCCRRAALDAATFSQFRREHMILDGIDTVDPEYGQRYLTYLHVYYPHLLDLFPHFAKNDLVGNPLVANYPTIGTVCPTTLRYIKTYGDLLSRFGQLQEKHIVEIGGGYGGLCRILGSQGAFQKYTIIDLPEPLLLARRYLESFGVEGVEYLEADRVPESLSSDLVISNYAFSECEREVQQGYLERVVGQANGGYMIYNFIGHVYNIRPYSSEEWFQKLNGSGFLVEREPENPGPNDFSNLLFTWKRP